MHSDAYQELVRLQELRDAEHRQELEAVQRERAAIEEQVSELQREKKEIPIHERTTKPTET